MLFMTERIQESVSCEKNSFKRIKSRCIANVLCGKMHVRRSGCKKRNRAHPNMVSVHDSSQENSSIDLLEVDMDG
jgi:hypothetical protein